MIDICIKRLTPHQRKLALAIAAAVDAQGPDASLDQIDALAVVTRNLAGVLFPDLPRQSLARASFNAVTGAFGR